MEYHEFLIDKYLIRLNTYQSRLLDNKYIGCVNIYSTLHLCSGQVILYYTILPTCVRCYPVLHTGIVSGIARIGSAQ